jgi:hypothetical protein
LASSKPKSRKSSSELESNSTEKSVKNQHLSSKDSGLNVSEHVSSEVSSSKKKGLSESSGEGKLGSVQAASMASEVASATTAAATAAAAVAAKQKSDREKLDLGREMSKMFGTSSDGEEVGFKNKVDLQQLHNQIRIKPLMLLVPGSRAKRFEPRKKEILLEDQVLVHVVKQLKVYLIS